LALLKEMDEGEFLTAQYNFAKESMEGQTWTSVRSGNNENLFEKTNLANFTITFTFRRRKITYLYIYRI